MKNNFSMFLGALLILAASPVFSADEDSDKIKIEEIISNCEDQYPEEKYADADERNKLIDQCIEEKSPSTTTQQE